MKRFLVYFFSLLITTSLFVASTFACTTFCLNKKGEVLFGKNYDYMIGDGLIFVNKRNVSKVSASNSPETPARWISRYGSVTFNQYGRENPMGGMNEAGLVIELMWLDETRYPGTDSRATVGVLEWIQYNLDTAATAREVIKNSEVIRIQSDIPLHYLVNDKNGNAATIEFLNGELIAHSGESLSVSALANDTYEKSWKYAKETREFGGPKPVPQTSSSFDRFTRAAQKVREFEQQPRSETEAVNYAFDILTNVAQKGHTRWSIVYDQIRGRIYFRTLKSPLIKSINMKSFDYSCGSAVKIFDVNSETSGDVTARFADYTRQANRDLIERSFIGTDFLKNTPAVVKESLAAYPENFACATGRE